MFTGLIEDVGTVRDVVQNAQTFRLTVSTNLPVAELVRGESIAVNGICLTVVAFGDGYFLADVSSETLNRTSLTGIRPGSFVNLERALRLADRLGGHLVTGHVDTVAALQERRQDGNAVHLRFEVDPKFHKYLAEKGSICIDGISLTINEITKAGFVVTVIPHTLAKTTLQSLQPGGQVNIETDIISKYLERLIGGGESGTVQESLSFELLAKHGFM